MKKNDQLGDKSLVKERILYKKQSAMEDHAKKICGTCMRKISPNNIHFVINDLMRDGKIWCGACKINKNYISYPNQAPSSPPWTTWSGIIMCDEDSDIGKKVRETDPNAEEGYIIVDKKKVQMPGKVRGLWTAPENGTW